MAQPGAQIADNGVFTMSAKSINIRVHPDEKPPEGCEPIDGGFFMLVRRRTKIKLKCPRRCIALQLKESCDRSYEPNFLIFDARGIKVDHAVVYVEVTNFSAEFDVRTTSRTARV